jgi:hypothetical protein
MRVAGSGFNHGVFTMVKRLLVAICLTASALQAPSHAQESTSPPTELIIPPGYRLVDDMLLPEQRLEGLLSPDVWPGHRVAYQFNSNVTTANRERALAAMAEIEAVANVKFVPLTPSWSGGWVIIRASNTNASVVGYGGPGIHSIQIASWGERFVIVHELMHLLGIHHEHQRPDRNQYIEVVTANIAPGAMINFEIVNATPNGPYDFESLMHYGFCTFSACPGLCTDPCYTIIPRPGYEHLLFVMGNRTHLSAGDIAALQQLYGAPVCDADFNGDGSLNPDDISDFITCFFLQVQFPGSCPQADFTADQLVNPDDLSDYIAAFFLGC